MLSKMFLVFQNTTSAMLIWTSCLPSDCRNDFIDVFINILDESITPFVDKYVPIGKYPIVHEITGILGFQLAFLFR